MQLISEVAKNAKAYIRQREEKNLTRTISKAAIDEQLTQFGHDFLKDQTFCLDLSETATKNLSKVF